MIEWRTLFHGWKEVTPEQAKRIVKRVLENSNVSKEKLIPHLNERRLRGITVEELLKEQEK